MPSVPMVFLVAFMFFSLIDSMIRDLPNRCMAFVLSAYPISYPLRCPECRSLPSSLPRDPSLALECMPQWWCSSSTVANIPPHSRRLPCWCCLRKWLIWWFLYFVCHFLLVLFYWRHSINLRNNRFKFTWVKTASSHQPHRNIITTPAPIPISHRSILNLGLHRSFFGRVPNNWHPPPQQQRTIRRNRANWGTLLISQWCSVKRSDSVGPSSQSAFSSQTLLQPARHQPDQQHPQRECEIDPSQLSGSHQTQFKRIEHFEHARI